MRFALAAAIWIGVLAFALPGVAQAADPADAKTVSEVVVTAIKTVSELVVTAPARCPRVSGALDLDAPHRPVVISSFPAKGQRVRPGLVVMRVTFDRPVACAGGFFDDPPQANPCPSRPQHMVLSYDRRTVRTVCLLDPDKLYGVRLNPPGAGNDFRAVEDAVGPEFALRSYQDPAGDVFRTADGAVGREFALRFSTNLEPPVTDVCVALREDVEMLAAVEKAHPLDCAPRVDPQAAMVKSVVELRDTAARAARERAIAEARALREQQAAAERARAETLALAAYRKARDRSWAETRRSLRRVRNPQDEQHLAEPDLTDPSKELVTVLPSSSAGEHAETPRLAEPTTPPELPHWRQAFVVGATTYDCAFRDGAVACERR